jgi:hypothetical protein
LGDFGGGRLASIEAGLDVTKQTAAAKAAKDAVKDLKLGNQEYMRAKPEVQAQMRADVEAKEYAGYGLKPPVAPATAPKAAPAAAAKPMSTTDFNAKWATLKSGQKLVGPDGIEYTKK